MSKLIERVANFCRKVSGQDMPMKLLSRQQLGRLPLVIANSYGCYEAVLMNVPVILLEVHGDDYTPRQLQKHQQIVTRLMGCCSVFAMENVASYHVSRMVEARVNFIIPEKQLFVPSLLLNLREVKDSRMLDDEVMPGISQCVLLFHLQRHSLTGWTTKRLVEKFKVSYASMNRGLRWLEGKGLIKMEGVKEKTLVMNGQGKELWEKALPLMLSPVERVLYTDEKLIGMPSAGESALEKFTLLMSPEIPCNAVSKVWATEQKHILNKSYGDYMVEVWRYDPMLLAEDNTVDRLSLYLSLQASDDERVRMELKNLMSHAKWLED